MSNAYVERYTEEILTPQRVNLRIRLRFEQGHLLEINEAVIVVEDSLARLITAITARMNMIICFFAMTVRRTFLACQTSRITSICLTT